MIRIFTTLAFLLLFAGALKAETEEETIEKCVNDLVSKDHMTRRRAVLLLSKYPSEYVFTKMIPSLEDKDEKVRQSVVVAFIESRRVYRAAIFPLMRRLEDKNVHTRRMVSSSLLPRLALYVSYGSGLPQKERKILLKTLQDTDSIVRKNMLKAYRSLKRVIPAHNFKHFLGDDDAQIRLLALMTFSSSFSFENIKPYLDKLISDKNPKIRLQTLKTISRFRASSMDYLEELAKDKDLNISSRAMAYSRNEKYLLQLKKSILDEGAASDLIRDLLSTIVSWNDGAQAFVASLLRHSDEIRRYAALQALYRVRFKIHHSKLMKLVNEDSVRIRKLACSFLSRGKLSAADLEKMAISDYSDIRKFSLTSVLKLYAKNPDVLDSLYELMLDEDLSIRSMALKTLWQLKLEDRFDIMEKSLSDDEKLIRNLAVQILLDSSELKARKILHKYLQKNKDVDVSLLKKINEITSIKKLVVDKPIGWQQKIMEVLKGDNMKMKKALVDSAIENKNIQVYKMVMNYYEKTQDQELYLYFYEAVQRSRR
ncbi:MAG: hypothetical protein HRT88_09415 [Lentisphaeraceae bacterium]|nr:hypothetical protein [Lentisphaeraceae bacterium]